MTTFSEHYANIVHTLKHHVTRYAFLLTLIYAAVSNASAFGVGSFLGGASKAIESASSSSAIAPAAAGTVEVGFSPEGSALQLVLKVINSSTKTLDVMAYSFTSSDITRAILNARKRGVRVRVIADEKQNTNAPGSKYAMSALSSLVNAGAEIRTNGNFSIFHDKSIIADGRTVQTGSFNYSKAAAKENSENVVILWGVPDVAAKYDSHFIQRWNSSQVFSGR